MVGIHATDNKNEGEKSEIIWDAERFFTELPERKFTLVAFDENNSEERKSFYEYLNAIFSIDLILINPHDDDFLDVIDDLETPFSPKLCVFMYGVQLAAPIELNFEEHSQKDLVDFIQKRIERRIEGISDSVDLYSEFSELEQQFSNEPSSAVAVFCTDQLSDETIADISVISQQKTAKATPLLCQEIWKGRTQEFTSSRQIESHFVTPGIMRALPSQGFMVIFRGNMEDVSPTLDLTFYEFVDASNADIVRALGKWTQQWHFPSAMVFNLKNKKQVEQSQRTYAIIYGDDHPKNNKEPIDFIMKQLKLMQKENVLPSDWIFGYAPGHGQDAKFFHKYGKGILTVVVRHNGYSYTSKLGKQFNGEGLRVISNEILGFPPVERSDPVPHKKKAGRVNIVVGLNFQEVVIESEQVVLLATYNPELHEWEDYHSKLSAIQKSISKKILKVCQMDIEGNTLPSSRGFGRYEPPTFYMYNPLTQEVSRKPAGYDLTKWVENHRFLPKEEENKQSEPKVEL
uniref:Uncharacterized protein n=1 Tax=Paramoeba aestuarina TaxID=180227 RepID=A0A7S4KIG5_9EUKA